MRTSETKLSELADLLAELCDSELDRHEWERLDALLLDDAEAQEFYRRFIALDVDLAWRGARKTGTGSVCATAPTLTSPPPGRLGKRCLSPLSVPADGACPPTPLRPRKAESPPGSSALPITSPSDHAALAAGPSSVFGSLLGSPALAYTVAALMLAVGIVSARVWSPAGDGQPALSQTPFCRCRRRGPRRRWLSAGSRR